MSKSKTLFERAKKCIPGGVNSPVRAFGSVGGSPLFIRSAKGGEITDADGKTYIDYVASWGPMILGHNHPAILEACIKAATDGLSFGAPCEYEVQLAELICNMTGCEMVRMVNSGTEATMSALRLARGYTARDKIIKLEGCYHGHSDSLLIKSGSGALTMGVPSSSGVPAAVARDTLIAQYNNLDSIREQLECNPDKIAAIIVEPVAANMGVVLPERGFLEGLRSLCDKHGTLLIFDEVITGFRLAAGGAQQYFGVRADIVTYGKIIGGGMPVGAYCGSREIMSMIAPLGSVYQAGTLSGNPVAMAAGIAQLSYLKDHPQVYIQIEAMAKKLAEGIKTAGARHGKAVSVNQIGSLCCAFATNRPVVDFESATSADTKAYSRYFAAMLQHGVYLAPSQFEAMFIGAAHTSEMIDKTIVAWENIFSESGE